MNPHERRISRLGWFLPRPPPPALEESGAVVARDPLWNSLAAGTRHTESKCGVPTVYPPQYVKNDSAEPHV